MKSTTVSSAADLLATEAATHLATWLVAERDKPVQLRLYVMSIQLQSSWSQRTSSVWTVRPCEMVYVASMNEATNERPHELKTFLMQDLHEMTSEYDRIRTRSAEDPGTAGDEGEEVWAELLRNWLPEDYTIVTKGRVLGADGSAGPQVDILVLCPGYPKRLLSKKLYLAGGVIAVFECKNTLTSRHIADSFGRAARVNALVPRRTGSPFVEMVPAIAFGLLAHSRVWKSSASQSIRLVDRLLQSGMQLLAHPSDVPVLICIADLACWTISRCVYDRTRTHAFSGLGSSPRNDRIA